MKKNSHTMGFLRRIMRWEVWNGVFLGKDSKRRFKKKRTKKETKCRYFDVRKLSGIWSKDITPKKIDRLWRVGISWNDLVRQRAKDKLGLKWKGVNLERYIIMRISQAKSQWQTAFEKNSKVWSSRCKTWQSQEPFRTSRKCEVAMVRPRDRETLLKKNSKARGSHRRPRNHEIF